MTYKLSRRVLEEPMELKNQRKNVAVIFELIALAGLLFGLLSVAVSYSAMPESFSVKHSPASVVKMFGRETMIQQACISLAIYLVATLIQHRPKLMGYRKPWKISAEFLPEYFMALSEFMLVGKASNAIFWGYQLFGLVQVAIGKWDNAGIERIELLWLVSVAVAQVRFFTRSYKLRER
jgi:hypothetical protein